MKTFWRSAILAGIIFSAQLPLHAASAVETSVSDPVSDQSCTSTREVDRLEMATDGALLVFTRGGNLRFQNGLWQKLTAPLNETQTAKIIVSQWCGQKVIVTLDGLRIGEGTAERSVPLPPSNGTHISALLPCGTVLWAAMFGDGLWQWDGRSWTKLEMKLPPLAREITALTMSQDHKTVWLGTRRQGVWNFLNGSWQQYLQRDEPFAHNVQFLQAFQGALWGSALEDGLIFHDVHGWKHFGKEVLSSNAPRQLVVFQNRLYVRHSNEVVDFFDGQRWAKNVFPKLPRRQIISLAADEKHLYLGQWGGWSEWDGTRFAHHLKIPELQIVPLMQIFSESERNGNGKLWLGTENRGLFEWDAKSQTLRRYDERDGLPDDWITSLGRNQNTLFAGTFSGGLACRNGSETSWQNEPKLNRLGVTSIIPDGPRRTLIATRYGLFCRTESGQLNAWDNGLTGGEREIQALFLTKTGLWLGTRNGLFFRTRATLEGNE